LLVVENDDRNRSLGIITATDLVAYLKENLNIDDVNTKILAFIDEHKEDDKGTRTTRRTTKRRILEEPRQGF